MTVKSKFFLTGLPLLFVLFSIFLYERMLDINFNEVPPNIIKQPWPGNGDSIVFKIGVVSRFSPSLLYRGYQPLIAYLNSQTPFHFELRLNKTYSEAVQQLASGELEAAFLGTYVFLKYMDFQPIHAFLAPLSSDGQPHFRIVLITREDFPYEKLTDFSGQRIGVPSPLSFSGNWLQKYILPKVWPAGKPKPQFVSYDFHHTVVQHLIRNDLAGGVVKDRVAEEYAGKGIRIVRRSRYIPASPLVRGPASDQRVIEAISDALTRIPDRKRMVLKEWDAEFRHGFVRVKDQLYKKFKQELKEGEMIGFISFHISH